MKKIYTLFLFVFFVSISGFSQVSLISDNFGTTAQNPIARTGWTANAASGSNWELRTTGASTGYSWTSPAFSASGGANVFTNLGTNTNTKTLIYNNSLSTVGYTTIVVRFGGLRSGTVPAIDVAYDAGSGYVSAGTVTLNTTWTAHSVSLPVGANGASNLRIRFSVVANNNAANFLRLDDFQVIGTASSCTAPSQASALTTNTPTTDGFSAAWTAGTGNGTMIVVRPTANANTLPANGTTYTPNLAWASAAQIDVNNRVIFRAAGTTAGPVTGLTAETQYNVTAYEYNSTGNCYNTTSPPSTTQYTLSLEPGAHPAAFSATACGNTSLTLGFSAASTITNADGYLILRRQDGTNPSITGITDGVAPGSLSLPVGTTLVTTIASTATLSYVDAGLSVGVAYNYLIVPYNSNAGLIAQTYNYLTSGSPKTSSATTGNASAVSDIIADPTFTYNSDILYANFQGNPITNTSNSVGVFGLRLRDGGGTSDADALPTTLTSVTFGVNAIAQSSVRRYALFQGNTFITELANPGTATVTFSSLSISAADNANADFTLRVSFNNTPATITDNTKMSFSITSATTVSGCATVSSQFNAFATVNSTTTGTINQIEVVATKLAFVQQPSNTTNGATMSPAVTVRGDDANNIQDLDQAATVSVVCSTPAALTAGGGPITPSAGVATFSGIIHGTDGTYTMTASATGLTSVVSNSYVISTFAYVTGDYRPVYDYDDFSYNNSTGMTDNWEYYNGSSWTTTPGDKAPQNATVTPTRIIIDHIVYGAGNSTKSYNDIVIQSGGELILRDDAVTFGTPTSDFIKAGKKIEVLNGGKLTIEGDIGLNSTANIIVRNGGILTIDQNSIDNGHLMWNGIELFEAGSVVNILNWDFAESTAGTRGLVNTYSTISDNVNGYKFGYLNIDVNNTTANEWTLTGGSSRYKLCENDLNISYQNNGLFDNFTDGNFTANPAWTVQAGGFNTATNLQGNATATDDRISTPNTGIAGYWQFDYNLQTTSGTSGQVVRFFLMSSNAALNTANGYYVYIDGSGVVSLRKLTAGTPSSIISSTWTANTSVHTVKVTRTTAGAFELFFDGSSKGTITDNSFTSSSFIGVWNTGVIASDNHIIDNIHVPSNSTYLYGNGNASSNTGFDVKGNMNITNGNFAFGATFATNTFNHVFNIDGNFSYTGTGTLKTHRTSAGTLNGLTSQINVKGNFTVDSTCIDFSGDKSTGTTPNQVSKLNLTGTGTPIQELKIFPTVTAVPITVKTGTSVLQKSFNITLNSLVSVTSDFTIEKNATYNFGFDNAGTTALVIKLAGSSAGTSRFVTDSLCTLKITHMNGLSNSTAFSASGNVQGIATANRSINPLATFWYIAKPTSAGSPAYTGNAMGNASNGRQIIIDLGTQNTAPSPPSNAIYLQGGTIGLSNSTSISPTGGKLDIRNGHFYESTTDYISSSSGTLYMAIRTGYYVYKGNATAAASYTDLIPRMEGVSYPYNLAGGQITLWGATSGNYYQTLRGGRTYPTINFAGGSGSDYQSISSNVTIDSSLNIGISYRLEGTTIINGTSGTTIVDCIDASGNPVAFQGNGGLYMVSGRLRIKMLNTPSPELTANNPNTTYALTGGTIEFYGSGATQQQQIRGTYGTPTKVIAYYNMDINAVAANYSTPPTIPTLDKSGNVDMTSSFTLQGALNVNSPAVLRMDESDFIYKFNGNATNNVNILSGAGLLYGSPFGITTVGTGGTGLEPSVGPANPSAGNIRTSIRNFNSGASYGFIGNGNMVSGDGIPSSVAGLYTHKTASADVDTLSKSVLNNGILGLYNGKILSSATNKLTLETTSTTVNLPTNAGGMANMGHENSYVIGPLGSNSNAVTEKIFPIGSTTKYGPLALTPLNANAQTYTCDYTSNGYGTYTLDPANTPQLDHVSLVEWWNVASNLSGSNDDAKVKLFWRTHSRVGPSASEWNQLRVAHFDGTDWNTEGNAPAFHASPSTIWGWVESNIYVPNFSPMTISTTISSNPLPVQLISFVGDCDGQNVQLNWTTATEENSKMFIIERSTDGINFTAIGNVTAAGFSNTTRNYTFIDALSSINNYYRLIEVDNDGKQQIFTIIKVSCDGVNGTNIFYTPTNGIEVETYSNSSKELLFNVYEVSGKLLHQEIKQINQGYNNFSLSIKNKLADGIYLIQQLDGDKSSSTKVWIH